MTPVIVGAGMAGLIAAHAWPQCPVVEKEHAPSERHRALLRFRSDAVSKLIGVEFRRVMVRKGIFVDGRFVAPNISLANAYAKKCLGQILPDRSIWNLDPVERFIAPDNLYEQMLDSVGNRICWNMGADFGSTRRPMISTAPLPMVLQHVGIDHDLQFDRAQIIVRRAQVPRCNAYQTVYFPGPETAMYRASLTGSTLIVEFARHDEGEDWLRLLDDVFALPGNVEVDPALHKQRYGKIAPVDDAKRKQLLLRLTQRHNIFSLGRFATWRNILLDDVVQDIDVVKRLLRGSAYDAQKAMA